MPEPPTAPNGHEILVAGLNMLLHTGDAAAATFMRSYCCAPPDAVIEWSLGTLDGCGTRWIVCARAGQDALAFRPDDACSLADWAEARMGAPGRPRPDPQLTTLIATLRRGARSILLEHALALNPDECWEAPRYIDWTPTCDETEWRLRKDMQDWCDYLNIEVRLVAPEDESHCQQDGDPAEWAWIAFENASDLSAFKQQWRP